MKRSQFLRGLAAAATSVFLPTLAAEPDAVAWPTRPVKIVVPGAAGQSVDILGRILADYLTKSLGQPFVVDNRVGAGGLIASGFVAKAPSDGYTLLIGSSGPLTIGPAVYKNVPFNTSRDFAPISNMAVVPQVLLVAAESPHKSSRELLDAARKQQLAFGTSPIGTTSHLALELLMKQTGAKFNHVPFRSNQEAATQVIGGDVAAMFDATSGAVNFVRSGRLRALAIAAKERSAFFPGVPTFAESGVSDLVALGWIGLLAPAGTPPAIVRKLHGQVVGMLASEQAQKSLSAQAFAPLGDTPEAFGASLRDELAKWSKLARDAGVRLE